jgi:hypothetical protein
MFCSIVLGFFVGALAFKALRHAMYFHGGGCGGYRHGYRGGPPWGPGYGRGYGPGYGAGCGSGYGARRHGPGWGPGWADRSGWGFHGHPGAYGGDDPRGFDGEPGFDGGQAVRARVKNVSLDEATRGLELHERQRAEAEPVVNRLKEWLGSRGPRISAVLTVLSQERFDAEALGPILGDLPPTERRELFEGLEHLHTILIPEQRESLRRALGLSQAPSGQSPPSV